MVDEDIAGPLDDRHRVRAHLKEAALAMEQGNAVGAEHAYRRAAELGSAEAMFVLATQAEERGELARAENWYRQAAAEHDMWQAMGNLAGLLKRRGAVDEAEAWYRRAATEHGIWQAMVNLATLLNQRGEAAKAEDWLRQARAAAPPHIADVLPTQIDTPSV